MSQSFDESFSQEQIEDLPDLSQETPPESVFIAPSIHRNDILSGHSYSHHSAVPETIVNATETECVLGVDEAGRGPVIGPMVYGVFYLPKTLHKSLLADTHHFDDSKVLTPTVRSELMQKLCTPETDLYKTCGWATRVMSARDISAGMMKATGAYNLNAQAMDATIALIHDVFAKGINVKEIYIDTIGNPATYQKKLERIFPTAQITVAKKADSLYPCVSAASVCAKVTRDAALEVCYESYKDDDMDMDEGESVVEHWGSGYPSDARCTRWLKQNMDPIFGWGAECRFSWGTVKDMLEAKNSPAKVDWPESDDGDDMKVSQYFVANGQDRSDVDFPLSTWFGRREVF